MFGINGKNKKQKNGDFSKISCFFLFNNYSHFICTLRAVFFPLKHSCLYNTKLYETLGKDDFH